MSFNKIFKCIDKSKIMNTTIYILVSVILVSIVSVIAAIPLLIKKKTSHKVLIFLMSISVGTMLGSVFIHFIPEILETGYTLTTAIYILIGFMTFFLVEKIIHWHHNKKCEQESGHSHAYHLAPLNLIGDGIHNFMDGLVISGSYIVSIPLGISATISIIFHEVPQEIADFGVLLYSGLSKLKAIVFNLLSALTAVLGAIAGILLTKQEGFNVFVIPFAAGSFIYIAASNIVPELHRQCKLTDTIIHIIAISLGIGLMIVLSILSPEHAH